MSPTFSWSKSFLAHFYSLVIPRLPRRWNGGIQDSPRCLSVCLSVRPSVCPSVDKVSRTFWKNYWLNSFHTWHLPLWSLLTPIHFRVPSFIFGPLVAKYLAENGVSGTFWKNYWLNSFHTWHLPLWGESLDPYTFSCSEPLCWIFLDEVGSDQSGGILSPFMGTACLFFLLWWQRTDCVSNFEVEKAKSYCIAFIMTNSPISVAQAHGSVS